MPKTAADQVQIAINTMISKIKEDHKYSDVLGDGIGLKNANTFYQIVKILDSISFIDCSTDVKGAAFEGLLEKSASEGKKGAGQYFTPRPLIQAIVKVMQPDPRGKEYTICDPACGTGGFLMVAYEWLMEITKGVLDREDAKRIKNSTYYGQDLVPRPRRLALMNMFLHGVEPHIKLGDTIYEPADSKRFDCILSNPPFGTKGAGSAPNRDDFTVETTNKQLNFLQHIVNVLKPNGRAAVVLPDNCLFEDVAADVFKIVMQDCNVHTILRLPRGTFTPYSQGVKANVVFLQKGKPTENTWIYDNRSNVPGITKKDRPLTIGHFTEFMACYGKDPNGQSPRTEKTSEENRWKKFNINDIKGRNYKLDISWLKDDSLEDADDLPEPNELIEDAIAELSAITDGLSEILALVDNGEEE
jgi:type I restriction enzyme M protein